jgi:hypothetical protein
MPMRSSSSCFGSPDTAGGGDEDVAVLESAVREGWDGYDRRAVAFVDHQVGPDRKLADFELGVADHAPVPFRGRRRDDAQLDPLWHDLAGDQALVDVVLPARQRQIDRLWHA